MIDIEKFLVSLRSNKDLDGKLKPIYLADTVQEEIKIIQTAVENSCREWVGLTDEDKEGIKNKATYNWDTTAGEYASEVQALTEAKLKEKNGG